MESSSHDSSRVAATLDPLRETETHFAALVNAAVDAIIVIDHQGRIQAFNKAAVGIFGYAPEEVLGQNVSMLMPEPHRGAHEGYLRNYLTTKKAQIIGIGREVNAVRKDGTEFPVDLAVGEVLSGDAPRFVGIVKDITERHRLEQETHQMQNELRHATRLNVLGEMATGIAHEINQPLTAITTYAQACQRMLANKTIDSAELENTLGMISGQAHRAGEVIRRLRAFAKKRITQRHVLQVNDVVEGAVKLAEADTRTRRFTVHQHLAPALPTVVADPVQIQQVILNLILNAMDAVEECVSQHKVVTVTTGIDDDHDVTISIADRGSGVSAESVEHLFDPFFSTKEAGTGMGLSVSRSIVTAHGGAIGHYSNPEGGTTFCFTLPPVN